MKITIIGYGSQGQRIHSLLRKKFKKISIFHPNKKNSIYSNDLKELKKTDIAFICSPNNTHLKYINILDDKTYIFCEKPPVNTKSQLKKLSKLLKKKKIYFNFNERFGEISKIINKNKKKLGNMLHSNFEIGYKIDKKNLSKSWKGNKKNAPRGVYEILSIHYIDLINYLFGIKEINNKLKKNSDGIVSSAVTNIISKKNSIVNIFCSFDTPFIFRKKMIFENGIIEEDEYSVKFFYNKSSLIKKTKRQKPLKLTSNIKKDYYSRYLNSIKMSVDFFLNHFIKNRYKKRILQISLQSTGFFLNGSFK